MACLCRCLGGMPKSFSHSHLPMHYTGPCMMPFQSNLASQGSLGSPRWLVREPLLSACLPPKSFGLCPATCPVMPPTAC